MSEESPNASVAPPAKLSPEAHRRANRLAAETSPYLLQHQHNPVDWYAWGSEAFATARAQDKPIFLSVGYSTCYWCHVMERESFETEAIAEEMNRRFINIKVDREERPDVDQLYMTFVQLANHHGGWPMSVFLTPDLKPFYGGTYFPPKDVGGRAGFVKVLQAVEDAYRSRHAEVVKVTEHYVGLLKRLAEPPAPEEGLTIDKAFIEKLIDRSTSDYDARHGGFGSAPKFPRQTLLEMLLVHNRQHSSTNLTRMLRHTLDALETGGIHDHLGGGFHRYSTDAEWLVPHFEIMLYDNAMLAWIYVEAYAQTQEMRYAHVARGIIDFVLREMTSPQGAFFTAFDAEVDAQEGLSYLWTVDEIRSLLGADAELFADVYGVARGPNFSDPHHGNGTPIKNILFLPETIEQVAARRRMTSEELYDRITRQKQTLYAARLRRKQPSLDTKVVTSWNALMIRALAYAGQILQEESYLRAAAKAAEFLLLHHRTPDGGLFRASRSLAAGVVGQLRQTRPDGAAAEGSAALATDIQGTTGDPASDLALDPPASHAAPAELAGAPAEGAKVAGFLDDYAFFIQALLALHDAGADERFKIAAHGLAAVMRDKFGDPAHGDFYFTEAGADDLIIRQKTASDSPLPSGNAVAAMSLLALGDAEAARRTIEAFAAALDRGAEGMSSMVEAAILYLQHHPAIRVADEPHASVEDEEGRQTATVPAVQVAQAVPPVDASAGKPLDGAVAQPVARPPSPHELADQAVTAQAEWTSPTELRLYLNVIKSFHLNAHEALAGLVATELRVTGPAAGLVAGIDYPPAAERRVGDTEEPLRLYEGAITLAVHFTQPPNGPDALPLVLTYQACDESACLPPTTKHFDVPLG